MEPHRFDRLTRTVSTMISRRGLASALGLAAIGLPGLVAAKKRKKNKKIKRNALGCVNVGRFCKKSGQCCSGICRGKKGKKKCRAHGTGGCPQGVDVCTGAAGDPCTTSAGQSGVCVLTTGDAPYCTAPGFGCDTCTRDSECQALHGPGAACIICATCPRTDGRTCAKPTFP